MNMPQAVINKAKHNGPCVFCGNKKAGSIDHLVPKSKGGPDSSDNLVPACVPCNHAKGNKSLDAFIASLSPAQKSKVHVNVAHAVAKNKKLIDDHAKLLAFLAEKQSKLGS